MSTPDLNLLVTLDVLLAEGSVARAARRLRLSPSAMSRALARLRETTGDPLLVRAGRGLVPTPRALELRERVGQLVQDAQAVLRPAERSTSSEARAHLHAAHQRRLRRDLRAGPHRPRRRGGARRAAALRAEARQGQRAAARRHASTWRPASSSTTTGPELRAQALFRDRFVGVVRPGHPLEQGQDHARPLCGRPARPRLARRGSTGARSTRPCEPLGLERESSPSSAASRPRWPWPAARPDRHRARTPHRQPARRHAQLSAAVRHRRSSPSRCCGTRGWMPIPRTAGCAAAFATSARSVGLIRPGTDLQARNRISSHAGTPT